MKGAAYGGHPYPEWISSELLFKALFKALDEAAHGSDHEPDAVVEGVLVGQRVVCLVCDGRGWNADGFGRYPRLCHSCMGAGKQEIRP